MQHLSYFYPARSSPLFWGFPSGNIRWARLDSDFLLQLLPRRFHGLAYQNLWHHKCIWLNLQNILGRCSRLIVKINSGTGPLKQPPEMETCQKKQMSLSSERAASQLSSARSNTTVDMSKNFGRSIAISKSRVSRTSSRMGQPPTQCLKF